MLTVLSTWDGDYGVPSVDIDTLILMTYVRFANINCTFKCEKYPVLFHTPALKIVNGKYCAKYAGFQAIWDYLRKERYDIDHFMSEKQKSDVFAYFKYMQNSLLPGINVTLWVDNQNYVQVTRKWYKNALIFPINILYTSYTSNKMRKYVAELAPEENTELYSFLLVDAAKNCIRDLSTKLGNKPYFFGSSPSSLDAIAYGYLAPLLNVPIPVPGLQTYLKEQENLVQFIKRVTKYAYPQQKVEYKYVKKLTAGEEDPQDLKMPLKTVAFVALCVGTAMITYGLVNGIIKVPG